MLEKFIGKRRPRSTLEGLLPAKNASSLGALLFFAGGWSHSTGSGKGHLRWIHAGFGSMNQINEEWIGPRGR
jgi:hypothetical protein